MFTPSTKAEIGAHDENISVDAHVRDRRRGATARAAGGVARVYSAARDHAAPKGIIIADTKFEFGLDRRRGHARRRGADAGLLAVLARGRRYEPGHGQPSFDKQYVRDWLEAPGWDKTPPAPALPADVIAKTSEKYIQAYELITGRDVRARKRLEANEPQKRHATTATRSRARARPARARASAKPKREAGDIAPTRPQEAGGQDRRSRALRRASPARSPCRHPPSTPGDEEAAPHLVDR